MQLRHARWDQMAFHDLCSAFRDPCSNNEAYIANPDLALLFSLIFLYESNLIWEINHFFRILIALKPATSIDPPKLPIRTAQILEGFFLGGGRGLPIRG